MTGVCVSALLGGTRTPALLCSCVKGTEVIFHQQCFISVADGLHYSILEGCWSTWVNTAIKETPINLQ